MGGERDRAAVEAEAARRVRVEGRVQGVGFRYWIESEAGKLGLRGYVRNLTDGTVEALFVGATEDLAWMLARCESGPSGGRVDKMNVEPVDEAVAEGWRAFHRAETDAPGTPPKL